MSSPFTSPPERRSAEIVSLSAWAQANRRLEAPRWDQHTLDIQPYQRAALAWLERQPALDPSDLWAAQAATAYLGDRIASPVAAIEVAFDPKTGRFNLPAYVAHALDGAPIVLPLPAPPNSLLARLMWGRH